MAFLFTIGLVVAAWGMVVTALAKRFGKPQYLIGLGRLFWKWRTK